MKIFYFMLGAIAIIFAGMQWFEIMNTPSLAIGFLWLSVGFSCFGVSEKY